MSIEVDQAVKAGEKEGMVDPTGGRAVNGGAITTELEGKGGAEDLKAAV